MMKVRMGGNYELRYQLTSDMPRTDVFRSSILARRGLKFSCLSEGLAYLSRSSEAERARCATLR